MSKLNYAIEIKDINEPLGKVLTMFNIISFWDLYKQQSKFTNWVNTNIKFLEQLSYDKNIINVLNLYYETDVNILIDRMNEYLKIVDKIKTPINEFSNLNTNRRLLNVATGGVRNIKNNILTILTAIPIYIFNRLAFNDNPENVSIDVLLEPITNPHPQAIAIMQHQRHIEQQQMDKELPKLKNIKSQYKLKFTISVNKLDYIIQFSTSSLSNEIKIYNEFQNIMTQDQFMKNKIVKMYNYGIIKRTELENLYIDIGENQLFLNPDVIGEELTLYNKIIEFFDNNVNKSNDSILYIVLDNDEKYIPLKHFIKKNQIIKFDDLFIKKVFSYYHYMNTSYGFCHFNLKSSKLLVLKTSETNSEPNYDIKFYDFSLSSTNNNPNSKIFIKLSNLTDKIIDIDFINSNFKRVGLLWDYYIFLKTMNATNLLTNNKEIDKILKIFIKFREMSEKTLITNKYEQILYIITHMIQNNVDNFDLFKNNEYILEGGNDYSKYLKYKKKYLSLKNSK